MRVKRNSKRTSGNLLSPLGPHEKDFGTASQTLLTKPNCKKKAKVASNHCTPGMNRDPLF